MKRNIPRFFGLRIYLLTTMLYFLLVLPFVIIVGMKSLPEIISKQKTFTLMNTGTQSRAAAQDTLGGNAGENTREAEPWLSVEAEAENQNFNIGDDTFDAVLRFYFQGYADKFFAGIIFQSSV
ncbi:MAG: hypothetical protein U5L09_12000 [Bacteroidales bacterium]|nr:hypothetical protein [Bacteroidales bacterium]